MSNATYLFIKPSRKYHSSERFWSSLFALYIFAASRSGRVALRAKQHTREGRFRDDGELKISSSLEFEDIVIEGSIGDTTFFEKVGFNKNGFPEEYWQIKPDVVIRDVINRKIIVIEVKTVGHSIGEYQKRLYENLIAFLRGNGCEAELYFLLSCGHEDNGDWNLLTEGNEPSHFKLLLWEDIIKEIADKTVELSSCFNGLNIIKYTQS